MASPSSTSGDSPTPTAASPTAACTSAVPDENGWVPVDACNSQYQYDPNFASACAFAVLFGLTFAAHAVQAIAWKKPFCWVLIMGASWEFLAFLLKTLGAKDQQNVGYVTSGQLLFLLAPLWINAFAYMTVARLVYFMLPDRRVCNVKAAWLTKIFIWADILCFLTQGAGGIMMSIDDLPPDDPVITIGQKVYIAGCGVQLGFVLLFCVIVARLLVKARRRANAHAGRLATALVWVMLAVLVMIVIRVVFRLVEFSPSPEEENHISTNEIYALMLDALPMVLALGMLNLVHPGWVLRGPDSEFPSKKEARREKAAAGASYKSIDNEQGC